ncbi:MAG: dephospho-CoA kinase [Synechococcaceae cyanobacterium]|nr:dephospho-CoA kinase [Synechococcaceae cyanobacterium]
MNRPRWQGSQRRIGLTGGIASGKSSVGRLLEARGLPLLDADRFAREALAPGTAGARAVIERYGERVLTAASAAAGACSFASDAIDRAVIDRAALGAIVFADSEERRWLEQLVHPLVRQRFERELDHLVAEPLVVLMIPLLFEAGLEGLCSEVWLVDCPETEQLRRLIARDLLSEAEARARIAAQWPLARKRELADRCIDNGGSPEQLPAALERALAGQTPQPALKPGVSPSASD